MGHDDSITNGGSRNPIQAAIAGAVTGSVGGFLVGYGGTTGTPIGRVICGVVGAGIAGSAGAARGFAGGLRRGGMDTDGIYNALQTGLDSGKETLQKRLDENDSTYKAANKASLQGGVKILEAAEEAAKKKNVG